MGKIEKFLGISYGSGSGSGDGDDDGSGSGSGSDDGDDDDDDDGSGSGYGDGSDDGSGYGSGSGYDDGIKTIDGQTIHKIDGIFTIIDTIKRNIAKGKIVNSDLTFEKCYIVKQENLFAHGKTLKQAQKSLVDKVLVNLPIEERIKEFKNKFKFGKKYAAKFFFDWHYRLTGSCELGRQNFIKNKGINLSDKFTVEEFVEAVKDSYGGDILKRITNNE